MKIYIRMYAVLLLTAISTSLKAQPYPRNLLSRYSREDVSRSLIPHDRWKPFPVSAEAWQQILPDTILKSIIQQADEDVRKPFEAITLTRFLDFVRNGNRNKYEAESFGKRERLFNLVLAEAVEGKGRFADAIANGVWSICEESYWGVPAHLFLQKEGFGLPDVQDPSVDLFASETAVVLAIADYFSGHLLDSISPLLRKRIYDETNRRVFLPLEKKKIAYNYLGTGTRDMPVNNWNPWVVSNWMLSLLLLEQDEQRRISELHHGMEIMDNYLNWMGEDGAVDEGPSYWFGAVGRLFDGLSVLDLATGGKITIYKEPLVRKLATYICNMHISEDYFLSIADASPVIQLDGNLLYRFGKALNDRQVAAFGAWAFQRTGYIDLHDFARVRVLQNLGVMKECAQAPAAEPHTNDTWMESVQLMITRTKGGLFIAAHGGHNAESHNHNDVGDVILFAHGKPVIVDVGFGTYTAKTFSKDRYTLWYNSTAYHNLPVINGFQQLAGRQYEARNVKYTNTTNSVSLKMDIAAAYPAEAGLKYWQREVKADRKKDILVMEDRYQSEQPLQSLTQTFMTICNTEMPKPGVVIFDAEGHKIKLEYDADTWDVTKEIIPTDKPDEVRLANNWGRRVIWRLLLTAKKKTAAGTFRYTFREIK